MSFFERPLSGAALTEWQHEASAGNGRGLARLLAEQILEGNFPASVECCPRRGSLLYLLVSSHHFEAAHFLYQRGAKLTEKESLLFSKDSNEYLCCRVFQGKLEDPTQALFQTLSNVKVLLTKADFLRTRIDILLRAGAQWFVDLGDVPFSALQDKLVQARDKCAYGGLQPLKPLLDLLGSLYEQTRSKRPDQLSDLSQLEGVKSAFWPCPMSAPWQGREIVDDPPLTSSEPSGMKNLN